MEDAKTQARVAAGVVGVVDGAEVVELVANAADTVKLVATKELDGRDVVMGDSVVEGESDKKEGETKTAAASAGESAEACVEDVEEIERKGAVPSEGEMRLAREGEEGGSGSPKAEEGDIISERKSEEAIESSTMRLFNNRL